MENVETLHFEEFGDERGSLVYLEGNRSIPFEIKRVFYIFGTLQGVRRGCHAHKKCEQVLVCTSGRCTISVYDGKTTEEYLLEGPKGLYIGPMIWGEQYDFSSGCVLTVFASDYYEEEDYIRNMDDYHTMLLN